MVPNVLVMIPCCCIWLAAGRPQQWTYRGGGGSSSDDMYRRPSIYDPLEVVDFELMAEPQQLPTTSTSRGSSAQYTYNNGRNFGGRNKYDLVVEPAVVTGGGRSRSYRLPLLSRGERDIMDEEEDEEQDNNLWQDEEDEEEEVPSCQELRRMWRIARRIHHRAIKTNKIPQETAHPFAEFESDRYEYTIDDETLFNKFLKKQPTLIQFCFQMLLYFIYT
jgi:hypothetical protein